jgi:hypothetical protein
MDMKRLIYPAWNPENGFYVELSCCMPIKNRLIIREWCDNHKSDYMYSEWASRYDFENEEDAVLFRLKWEYND